VIIDHGGGYMSLYGHNEALLKESGDWVQPGETIAQVGDSGGAPKPALYFEIRFKGEPVNPHTWITRPTLGR
jgi:septal ring factor EnvC (AmiA/AmiB activator)